MTLLDMRPARVDLYVRPGDDHSVVLTWPDDLDGRTFTASLLAADLDIDLDGAVMTIAIPDTVTEDVISGATWALEETTGDVDQTIITGRVIASRHGAGTPNRSATVQLSTTTITVSVVGGVAGSVAGVVADLAAEVTRATTAEATKVAKAGDTMTGPLSLSGDPTNDSHATRRSYVLAQISAAVAALLDSAPGALDTLNELAAALGDDANFAATVTNALAGKQPLDADLTAIAALTTAPFGRSLLELADSGELGDLVGGGGGAPLEQSVFNVHTYGSIVVGSTTLADVETNTVTCEAAIAAAKAAGGGHVFADVLGTVYIRRPLVLPSNVTLSGWRGGTIIKRLGTVKSLLTATAAAGQANVTVADGSVFSVGDAVSVYSEGRLETDTFQANIDAKVGNILTLDRNISAPGNFTVAQGATVVTTFPLVINEVAYLKAPTGAASTDSNIVVRDITLDQNRNANDPRGTLGAHVDFTTSTIAWIAAYQCRVQNVEILNACGDAYSDQGRLAVGVHKGHNTISGCHIRNPLRHGIHLGSTIQGGNVEGNFVTGAGIAEVGVTGYGMFYCAAVTGTTARGNTFRDCYAGFAGIDYRDTDNAIASNVLINITGRAIDAVGSDVDGTGGRLAIMGNIIIGCGDGVALDVPDCAVKGNTIYGVITRAIFLGSKASRSVVEGNNGYGSLSGYGIGIEANSDSRVVNNGMRHFSTGAYCSGTTRLVAIGNHLSDMLTAVGWDFLGATSTDCTIRDEQNTLTNPVVETTPATRLVYEGLGNNGTDDPAAAGQWNGVTGKRHNGRMVRWTSAGEKVSIFFNGVGWTLLNSAGSLDVEAVQDIVGAMVSGNTESGVSVTYDDVGGKLNFELAEPPLEGAVFDSFTRADGAIGNAESGQTWLTTGGTWVVASERMTRTDAGGSHHVAHISLGAGHTDHRIEASIYGSASATGGLVARFVDSNNHYLLNLSIGSACWLYKKVGGSFTLLDSPVDVPVSGDAWELSAVGTTIAVKRNGATIISVTDAALSAGTICGVDVETGSSAMQFDDVIMDDVP